MAGDEVNAPLSTSRRHVRVRGLVQGVGFRPHVFALADELGLTGWVKNDEAGVELEVQGAFVDPFIHRLAGDAPPLARVDDLEVTAVPVVAGESGFRIIASEKHGATSSAIGPDAAVCEACLAEMFDPSGRRYRYPFLTCTHCGPRFTITRALPYDRPQTSLAPFPMCEACRREYEDPRDRRFHAQPIACPACGPSLSLRVEDVAAHVRAQRIVALKGLGGFHLVCDARSPTAVAALRTRKERDAKPFAVMVLNVASARHIAVVPPQEAVMLRGTTRPIVLVQKAAGADELAPLLAPDLSTVGVMLPYTPLHYLLFHELLGRPAGTAWLSAPCEVVLVMTSANPGGEPLVKDDAEAALRLQGIADVVVGHDREILVRADDSVMRFSAGAPRFIRRARGFVPLPIRLPREVPPVLGVGALLKNTVCFTRGQSAYVSQHVGDLDTPATARFLEETVEHLGRTLEVTPVAVGHDLHPDFLSTELARRLGVPAVPVQHHHAHVAAVAAEYGIDGPLLGLALDGFGMGPQGELWGGELLDVDGARFRRAGSLRPLRLPGGDVAARAPWRMAAAALHELGRWEQLSSVVGERPGLGALRSMLTTGFRAPWTSSCGRWFDAACGILGIRPECSFEGEAPMVLESLVTSPRVLEGTWLVRDGVLDLLPLLEALIGRDPHDGADVFHGTLAAALVDWALPAIGSRGVVALTGGCMLNEVLASQLVRRFHSHGVEALLPRQLPPNDGGISLGQAWVTALSCER